MRTITTILFLFLAQTMIGQVEGPAWRYSTQEEKEAFDKVAEKVTGFHFKETLPPAVWRRVDVILRSEGTLIAAYKAKKALTPYSKEDKHTIQPSKEQLELLSKNRTLRKLELPKKEKKTLVVGTSEEALKNLSEGAVGPLAATVTGKKPKELPGRTPHRSEQEDLFVTPILKFSFSKVSPEETLRLGRVDRVTDGVQGADMVERALDSSFSYSLNKDQLTPYRVLDRLRKYESYGLPTGEECQEALKNLNDGELSPGEAAKGFYTAFRYGHEGDYVLPNGRKLSKADFFVITGRGESAEKQPELTKPDRKRESGQEAGKDTIVVQQGSDKPSVVNNYNQNFNIHLEEKKDAVAEKDTSQEEPVNPWVGKRFIVAPQAGLMPATAQDQNDASFQWGVWAGAFLADDPSKGLWHNLGLGVGFHRGSFFAHIEKKNPPVGDLRGQGYIEREGTYTGWKAVVMFRQRERKDFLMWGTFGYDKYAVKESSFEEITDLQGAPKQAIEINVLEPERKLPRAGLGVAFFPWKNIALGAEFGFYVPGESYAGWEYELTLPDGTRVERTLGGGSDFYLSSMLFNIIINF